MRKQTKIVAVASAAALLAIGASMTAFAATGWVEEDGTWYYYDRDENRVEDEWKRSGDNWYWLSGDEDGAMAVDTLVEDGDYTYYVDANGVMVRNTWVRIVNEDQDDDDDPAEYRYYYFQSNGKAYKGSGDKVNKKTIDGKVYAFDDDGKMLYGWVDGSGDMQNGEDGWQDALYYFGNWDDGSMKTDWQRIYVHDDRDNDKDDDYYYWFNFKANGQKRRADDSWRSGKSYYSFDDAGVMVYQWSYAHYETASKNNASISNWRYFSSPEDGARLTKGWFKVVPPEDDNTFEETQATFAQSDTDDETERWYYADKNGYLYEGTIEGIKGKYYGFYPYNSYGTDTTLDGKGGHMLSGLVLLQTEVDENGKFRITNVIDDGVDSDELEDILDPASNLYAKYFNAKDENENAHLYYFGNDEDHDGAMKTGNITVTLDGDNYSFYFQKTGSIASGKGQGVNGIDDNKYIYKNGCRIKANSDDKYQLVWVASENDKYSDVNSGKANVQRIDDLAGYAQGSYKNDDGETVHYVYLEGDAAAWNEDHPKDAGHYYLVNTSGNIQKNKSAAKNGDDCYYYVNKDRHVTLFTDNKNLKSAEDESFVVGKNDADTLIAAITKASGNN